LIRARKSAAIFLRIQDEDHFVHLRGVLRKRQERREYLNAISANPA